MRIAREPARAGRFPLRTPFDQWIVLQRTIARGGLCLTGVVHESEDGVGIHLGPGAVPTAQTNRWLTPQTGLLPRDMVLIREEAGSLRGHPTPWCECPDGPRALAPRVSELWTTEESAQAYRELLDPEEAAELLVSHAVVPLCDEALLERVLANARRIAAAHRVLRFGEPASGVRPVAWPSAELANGYLPLRTTP